MGNKKKIKSKVDSKDAFEKKWLNEHLKKIKNKAGQRYTPELNVELPISDIFDGICRNKKFYVTIRTHSGKLEQKQYEVRPGYKDQKIIRYSSLFTEAVASLILLTKNIKTYNTKNIEWKSIDFYSRQAETLSWVLIDKLQVEKEKAEKDGNNKKQQTNGPSYSERVSYDIHRIYEIQKELRFFKEFSKSTAAKLSNNPFLLIRGDAGKGKTHLLCDVLENRINDSFASVLLFGEFFSSGDFWKQALSQLSLLDNYSSSKMLKKLDKIGKENGNRSLLIIDALNESKPITYWKKRLIGLVKEIKKYHHIALVVSIRSNFEKEVLPKAAEKLFVFEEHNGFEFREWEAVNKFFNAFSLPLPEIPLLTPEFQNPLFLLLFCKAVQGLPNKKTFKGHVGATYIFEKYVDTVSKKIENDFGIDHGPNKNIWDTVIEKVASEMVEKNTDRISVDILNKIIKKYHPGINQVKLASEIEKNFLLIKIPHYSLDSGEVSGFDYRFPFQKFSDHLIGRFLFKKYELEFGKTNKNLQTAKKFFSRRRKLGKFITHNHGIVEALSIQCPEHLKGCELIEVAPYLKNSYLLREAFVESLIWRKPSAFSTDKKSTLNYINGEIIKNEYSNNNLLNAFLTVAPIPEHPFNADFLHKHLLTFSMPKRDAWWSKFLHYQYGGRGSVDRLVEWGWSSQNKDNISDTSIRLYSTVLIWFLTSSNRFLRDRCTKALVTVLTDRLEVVVELLELFKKADDPYLIERLFAVAYGCAIRNSDNKKGLKKICNWFLINFFNKHFVRPHILMRDYARGVIEVGMKQGIINKKQYLSALPPYKSKWPKNTPTEKFLRKKYYPDDFFKDKTRDRGFLSIWSSVMHDFGSLADFGNYEVNSELRNWTGRRLEKKEINRKEFFEKFKKGLTKTQLKLWNKINPIFNINWKNLSFIIDSKNKTGSSLDEEEIKKQEVMAKKKRVDAFEKFEASLSKRKLYIFKKEIKPYLNDSGSVSDPLERFNTGLGQRWIFNRVVKLGWDPVLHNKFDENINRSISDRREHKAERIGKKYQWIALHELIALVSDNFEFMSDSWSNKVEKFKGAWQTGIRDIDPSCTLKNPVDIKIIDDIPFIENYKPNYDAWRRKGYYKTWLSDKNELPDPKLVIKQIDNQKKEWVVLEGFCEWQEEIPPEYEKYKLPTKTLYFMIKSYLVKNENKDKIFDWAKKQKFYGRWMPESSEFYNVFLGEYPSYSAFLYHYIPYFNHDDWVDSSRHNKIPAQILVTDDEYLSSGSSLDCSTEETIRVKLPAKWIVDKMKLKQKYIDGRFYDRSGELVAFNPSVFFSEAPSYLLMRKDKLQNFLIKEKLGIFWTILGEKQTIGGNEIGQPYGWQEINGSYTINNKGKIIGSVKSEYKKSR